MKSVRARPGRAGAVITAAWLAILAGGGGGAAQEFQVDLDADRRVRFVSRAAIEEFDGTTDHIDGYVLLDGAALGSGAAGEDTEFYLEVDLASLDTGIGLRDRHMRDNYLEVGKFPYATFTGHVARTEETPSGDFRVTASGALTIHGVEKPRDLTCRVMPNGERYRVICAFEVLLTDHQIEIPKVMFLKLANEIRVELDFTVKAVDHPGARS